MDSSELSMSSSSSTTFGIQSAGEAYESSGALFTQGCKINESQGCSTACQDPFQITLGSTHVAELHGTVELAPNPVLQSSGGANPSERSVEIAGRFAINTTNPGFQSLASNVIRTIQGWFRGGFGYGRAPAMVSLYS
ncbi:hypothetical protein HO173_010776 [Letharia columbiana]|uniref:Uncharacterized protein n=1 Tax=Letharia columbiana TaxID=112416 RepID=A0A8H6L0L6_9LECA|nr:uncharacterized protein HO173_010776 [Letharia columbiana]KAF6231076.1 hypothetical protein HO173_010776 [Letharia columbiana]